MGASELKALVFTLLVLLALACGILIGGQRCSITTQGGVVATLASSPGAGPAAAAAPEPAAALREPQWCSQRGSEEEVFECCFKEREGYKDLLGERGVHVKGKTEAYGPWGAAAKEEIRLLFELLRAAEATAARGRPFTVCETGFNWGGTSHIFLCASRTNATVLSFDLEKSRSVVPNQALTERYGSRLKLTIGDSKVVLANLARSDTPPDCNFVYVDGGHSKDVAKADMINFAKMSRPGTPMVADDCYAEGSLKPGGPKQAFNDMVKDRVVADEYEARGSLTNQTSPKLPVLQVKPRVASSAEDKDDEYEARGGQGAEPHSLSPSVCQIA